MWLESLYTCFPIAYLISLADLLRWNQTLDPSDGLKMAFPINAGVLHYMAAVVNSRVKFMDGLLIIRPIVMTISWRTAVIMPSGSVCVGLTALVWWQYVVKEDEVIGKSFSDVQDIKMFRTNFQKIFTRVYISSAFWQFKSSLLTATFAQRVKRKMRAIHLGQFLSYKNPSSWYMFRSKPI